MSNKKLPIGVQNFESLRKDGYFYVDKTAHVYNMVNRGKYYFLSRPRRFGKSLLLSTIEAYMQGKKELFEGLAIYDLEKEWVKHPIFHLDLNSQKYDTPESLEYVLEDALAYWESLYGANESEKSFSLRFQGIIRRACEKTGQRVVILVDEYDKPMLQAIGNEELQSTFRNTLKPFYGCLKSMDGYIKLGLLTGVTNFSHVSVFSDLNQLNDISMDYDYATLCGITHDELISNFSNEIEETAKSNDLSVEETIREMTAQYDGYRFHHKAEGVFNPFSVLNCFFKKEFGSYWFQTGTPTFLVKLLQESDYDLRRLIEGVETSVSAFKEYRAEKNNPIPLIFQSGYLTIKGYDKEFKLYNLGFPNDEVRYGFLNFLLPYYTPISEDERGFYIGKFVQELKNGNTDAFMQRLEVFFADFPYELNDKTERHYQVILYLVFKLMGQFTQAEVHSAIGRADAIVQTTNYIYLFEFKLNGTAEEALQQINEKQYALPFETDGRKLFKIGVNFSSEKRNIDRWVVEE